MFIVLLKSAKHSIELEVFVVRFDSSRIYFKDKVVWTGPVQTEGPIGPPPLLRGCALNRGAPIQPPQPSCVVGLASQAQPSRELQLSSFKNELFIVLHLA